MPERALRKILNELHASLEDASDLDADARAALRSTADEILAALEGSQRDGSLGARLSDSLERFEGGHPRLTEALRRLVDQLAEMGI